MTDFRIETALNSDDAGTFPMAVRELDHAVQFYRDDRDLVEVAGRFIASGLRHGQSAVIIATSAHAAVFREALEIAGVDVAGEERKERLAFFDAERTLAGFLVDGMPDASRFDQTVGSLIARHVQAAGTRGLRAYGEMVDLLWRSGREEAAIRLEEPQQAGASEGMDGPRHDRAQRP